MKLWTRILTVFNMIIPNYPLINPVFTTDGSFFVRVPLSEKEGSPIGICRGFKPFYFQILFFENKKDCSLLIWNLT